jgi:S1-C subfamily serine protease
MRSNIGRGEAWLKDIRTQDEMPRAGNAQSGKCPRAAKAPREQTIVKRVISGLLCVGLTLSLSLSGASLSGEPGTVAAPLSEPVVTLLDMHPVDPAKYPGGQGGVQGIPGSMPNIVRQGDAMVSDQRQIRLPAVVTPAMPADEASAGTGGKAGTGFFIGEDGTLLTAAHVASGCGRMQIISKYVARTWVSLVASDQVHDIALLKAPDLRPPSVVHLASVAPTSGKLFILGYPATAGLTVPAETWAVMQNEKFPPDIGSLADPRDLLWLSAPEVTHGYSGGPIFDPRLGAVVGIVKGEVDGGYLRLVRDMPTTGVAIGPGIGSISALVRREVPYVAVSLVSSPGDAGVDALRRATVHVLCWH